MKVVRMGGPSPESSGLATTCHNVSYCIWQQKHLTWLVEPMMEKAGLVVEQADYSDDQIFARYIA